MKNNMLKMLQDTALRGRKEGILIGIDIVAIALNEEYHFGQKMLGRLDKPVQEILDEMTTYKDMEVLAARIAQRLATIRKQDADFFLDKYIKL